MLRIISGTYRVVGGGHGEPLLRLPPLLCNVVLGEDLDHPVLEVPEYLSLRTEVPTVLTYVSCSSAEVRVLGYRVPPARAVPVPAGARIEVKCGRGSVTYLTFRNLEVEGTELRARPVEHSTEYLRELRGRYVPPKYLRLPRSTLPLLTGKDLDLEVRSVEVRNPELLLETSTGEVLRIGVRSYHVARGPDVLGQVPELELNLALLQGPIFRIRSQVSTLALDLKTYVERVRQVVERAAEAARRGAKLFRVRIGEEVYDIWVEEVP